jgi:hypothetical protein
MTFVFSVLLGGMVLVGIPVLIHLIMRQKPKILPFPAFRFLVQRSKKNLRKLRLRHLLLLMLRMLLLAAICLALARPKLFQSGLSLSADRPVAAILLFDTSLSMGYKSGDGVTRLEEAKNKGLELLNELPEGSRVAILDTAEAVASRGEWHKSLHQAREQIKELKLKPANASVSVRLQDAYRMFAALAQSKEDNPPLQDLPRFLCVFSDRTRAAWDPARQAQLFEANDQIPPTLPGLTRVRDSIPALIDSLKELRKTLPPQAGQDYPEQALIDALTPLREAIAGLGAEDIADNKELPKLLDAVRKPARQIVASLHGTKEDKLSTDTKEYRQKLLSSLQAALSAMQGVYSLFIDVGVDRPVDLAISNLEMRDEFGQPQQAFAGNRKVILRADVKATGKDYNTTIQFRIIGTKTFEWAVVVKAGETKPEFFRLDCTELGLSPGPQQVEVRLGTGDLLPFNNSRFATFLVREPRRVLVLTDNTEQAEYFRKALVANGFTPEVKSPGDFANLNLNRYQAIFLFNLSLPKEELWKDLDKEYVQKGGGLGIIPGGAEINLDAYNKGPAQNLMPGKLNKIVHLKKTVSPKKIKGEREGDEEPGEIWNLGQESIYQHPILRPFKDWTEFDLVRSPRKAVKYWEVEPAKKVGSVLVSYTGDKRHPALLERLSDSGKERKGKVLLFTTKMDGDSKDVWNNYMSNSFFVVITGLTAKYLAGDLQAVQLNFLSGQADPKVKLPMEARYPAYSLRGPDLLEPIAVEDGQNDLVLKQAVQPGNYNVDGVTGEGNTGKRVAGFSVNIPPEESDLTRVPLAEIEALFGAATVVPVERKTNIRESLQGHWNQPLELFPFLMILLLLVLAVENLLANKFYKKESENNP